ncbi:hypothetical protein G5714_000092 [Onychostoma macrolepis]|uniref:Uncharacterized protein n=1 Tax=Onychostoma macrolepis TaxID=369639 RepID=A0A7J6DG27_9TELE|nr:hypothetical protein G5714_000092 [Onychostoma macrolepis]
MRTAPVQTSMSVQIQMFVAQMPTASIIQAATAANATRVTVTMATTSQNASLKHLMSLLKSSCESLNDPRGEHFTGEKLLESLCSSSDELLSDGNIDDGKMLSHFLDAMENSVRLIGPQLREPVTRMEMHNMSHNTVSKRQEDSIAGKTEE